MLTDQQLLFIYLVFKKIHSYRRKRTSTRKTLKVGKKLEKGVKIKENTRINNYNWESGRL